MRTRIILFLLLLHTLSLFAYGDFERIFSFDSTDPYGFICPSHEAGSYYYLETGGVVEVPLIPFADGWKQGDMPQPGYIGFRSGIFPLVNPVYMPSEPSFPAYTPLETDPLGDNSIPQTSLDIVETRVSFDSERIYFAIRSASETYPVSSGLTFYAYMPVLVNPYVDPETNPTVYGLMYTVNMGVVISPGLYKITGVSLDGLSRIGDIQSSVQGGWLFLSCAISDLLADTDLNEWLDSDYPLFATVTTTSQITLTTGIQEADYTTGAVLLLKAHELSGLNLNPPVLQNLTYELGMDELQLNSLTITYSDVDNNVPRQAYLRVNGVNVADLNLLSLESPAFTDGVQYGVNEVSLPTDWEEMYVVFSDDLQFVEILIERPVSNQDYMQVPAAKLSVYPNPTRDIASLKSDANADFDLGIFNIKGQRVGNMRIAGGKQETQLDLSAHPDGLYFIKTKLGPVLKIIKY